MSAAVPLVICAMRVCFQSTILDEWILSWFLNWTRTVRLIKVLQLLSWKRLQGLGTWRPQMSLGVHTVRVCPMNVV